MNFVICDYNKKELNTYFDNKLNEYRDITHFVSNGILLYPSPDASYPIPIPSDYEE